MARRGEQVSSDRLLADIGEQACAEARGAVDAPLLSGYLPALVTATAHGRRLSRSDLRRCRDLGARAARDGVALPAIVDAYLSATRIAWAKLEVLLPAGKARLPERTLTAAGQTVLRAADDALAAVSEGYVAAGRSLIRAEEARRREFVDDLLGGIAEIHGLVSRAERFGLRLTAPHQVFVIRATRAFRDTGVAVSGVEEYLRARAPRREAMVAAKDGYLVCVMAASTLDSSGLIVPDWLGDLAARAARDLAAGEAWRAVIGRVQAGPTGIATSYQEGREALDLAERIGWPEPVISVQRLAVYRVLLRDVDAMTELVDTVLGPLAAARGGATPLLNTLCAFFANGAVATATARALHLSVRAVTYRLARIRTLTGYDPTDPADWLTLHVAATGAKLLGRPTV